MPSWKPEVQVAGEGDKWHANALRFKTKEEAEAYAADLFSRWTQATAHRASECEDDVNYAWVGDKLIPTEEGKF